MAWLTVWGVRTINPSKWNSILLASTVTMKTDITQGERRQGLPNIQREKYDLTITLVLDWNQCPGKKFDVVLCREIVITEHRLLFNKTSF